MTHTQQKIIKLFIKQTKNFMELIIISEVKNMELQW